MNDYFASLAITIDSNIPDKTLSFHTYINYYNYFSFYFHNTYESEILNISSNLKPTQCKLNILPVHISLKN